MNRVLAVVLFANAGVYLLGAVAASGQPSSRRREVLMRLLGLALAATMARAGVVLWGLP